MGAYQWTQPFHPDDMAETRQRWERSLRTGEPYVVEYRCKTKEGEWRWMLGRALPLRNPDTGKIEKWIGTCTDVHDSIEAKLAARRTRQQLLSVIAHAHVTIFTVDVHRKITMLEGALMENEEMDQLSGNASCLGGNVDEVFNRLHRELPEGQRPDFLTAIDAIIDRKVGDVVVEHSISKPSRTKLPDPLPADPTTLGAHLPIGTNTDDRYFRTRFLPMMVRKTKGDEKSDENIAELPGNEVEGVIGIIMDVTEVKAKEAVLEAQAKEKQQLLANEAAAKEASRLKSQFLANVRTRVCFSGVGSTLLTKCRCLMRFGPPLLESSVRHAYSRDVLNKSLPDRLIETDLMLGMAELLLDVDLTAEQREYAENIFRSGNALLTVINDILDFSKVESGRLDIEVCRLTYYQSMRPRFDLALPF